MAALTAKAALVDPETLAAGGQAVTTRIPRAEIEEALGADESPDLFIDVQRIRDGEKHEVESEHRITVSWEPADLERLLSSTTGDEVTFAFKPDELERMLEEPDVEAQGLREKVAVLTVAATAAAGIAAGAASAQLATDAGAGGGAAATPAFVTDTTSGGAPESLQAQEQAFRVSEESATGGVTDSSQQAAKHQALGQLDEGSGKLVTDTTSSGPGAAVDETGGTQFLTDATSSGPGAATEEAGGTAFLTDATSSGPQEAAAESGGTNLVTDTTSSGPAQAGAGLQAEEHAFRVSEASAADTGGTNLVTDTTSSGPGQSVEAAPAGGGESFLSTAGGEAALIGGIALLIAGAGFVGTRQRGRVQPT